MTLRAILLRTIGFLLILVNYPAASAQDDTGLDSEIKYYADQYARCAAFFAVAKGYADEPLSYNEYQYGASAYAFILVDQGKHERKTMQRMTSLIETYEKQLLEEIDGSDDNAASLIDRYHQDCVAMVIEPPQVVQDLMMELEEFEEE